MKSPLLPYLLLGVALLGAFTSAQEDGRPTAAAAASEEVDPIEALIRDEQIRSLVDQAFQQYSELLSTESDSDLFVRRYVDIVFDIGSADPAVVPLLANEMLQNNPETFYLAAYALGVQGTPEAIEAIREAIRVADSEGSQFAEARKVHLIWTLAVAGEAEAITISGTGRHKVGMAGHGRGATVIEVASMLTYPDSLEPLHAEFSKPGLESDERRTRVRHLIRAIGRLGDPSSLELFLAQRKNPSGRIRQMIAEGLRFFDSKKAVDALFELLSDEDYRVAMQASSSLNWLAPRGRDEQIIKALADAETSEVRRPLYLLLARISPDKAIEQFKIHWARPDRADRYSIVQAAGMTGDPKAIDLLTLALTSGDSGAATLALTALGKIGTERANGILLHAIRNGDWSIAQNASMTATQLSTPKAAETIRKRLLDVELPPLERSASTRPNAEWLLDRLLDLRDTDSVEPLRAALKTQRDPLLIKRVNETIRILELVASNGDDLAKWVGSVIAEDEAEREMANRYLRDQPASGEISTALSKAFGRAEPEAIDALVTTLASHPSDAASALVERILTGEEFSSTRWNELRDAAAWAASRFGGESMVQALGQAIDLRRGRDPRVLSYYAIAAGPAAIERIERWRSTRMRFSYTTRANEWNHLQKILILLRRGEELTFTDLPPAELNFLMR